MRTLALLLVAMMCACTPQSSPPSSDTGSEVTVVTPRMRSHPTGVFGDASWQLKPRAPLGGGDIRASGMRPPITPVSWTIPAWYVNPSTGNDTNNCQTSGTACKTFAEIAARWGTYSPILSQATSITFTADQPNNSDPVILRPILRDPGTLFLTGTLTTVTWGSSTLGTVTAATNTVPLQINVNQAASAAAGLLIDNTTHASREWCDTASSNTCTVTNPVTKAVVPTVATLMPTLGKAVAGTATTDAFTIQQPSKVYLVDFEPTVAAGPASFNGPQATVSDIWVPDTGGAGASQLTLNDNVWMQESRVDSFVRYVSQSINDGNPFGFYNCWLSGAGQFVGTTLIAGAVGTLALFQQWFSNSLLDGGLLVQGASFFQASGGSKINNNLGNVYFLGALTQTISNLTAINNSLSYGLGIKGSFTINTNPGGVVGYGTSAAASFLGTTTLKMNGATTACSVTLAIPAVWNCGITVNPTNLDAAAGAAGFGGRAIDLSSGSLFVKTS
jgi:hypothetical protein